MPQNKPMLAAFRQLEAWTLADTPKRVFLKEIDGLREHFFAAASAAYRDDYYAKLLTLKILNLLLARYHHRARHSVIASQPFTLMIDPVNACQLQCPGCVHSNNEDFVRNLRWPSGRMSVDTFRHLLQSHGPFALNTVLYNYGEPLLHKRFPEFVTLAHEYAMTTHVSTNLAMPINAEQLVRAAPDHMILSIDGASQETYGRYRKGGTLHQVLRNVESLVDWKQRLNYNRPILVWRFFAFSHNVHETQQCIELARDLGVDQVIIGRPFDVSNDDPEILSVDSDLKGTRIDFTDRRQRTWRPSAILGGLGRHDHVDRLFDSGFATLLTKADLDEPPRPNTPTCSWLYSNLTVDAVGRVLPCCISPTSKKRLVYGQLDADFARRWLDSPMFRTARDGLANGGQPPREKVTVSDPPYCLACRSQPTMTYTIENAVRDLATLDFHNVFVDRSHSFWRSVQDWT